MESQEYKTDDLALAAYLWMKGRRHVRVETEAVPRRTGGMVNRGYWIHVHDARLLELVDEFKAEEALVEPLEFLQTVRKVRQELYSLLGMGR